MFSCRLGLRDFGIFEVCDFNARKAYNSFHLFAFR
jgi:hypothetical protein